MWNRPTLKVGTLALGSLGCSQRDAPGRKMLGTFSSGRMARVAGPAEPNCQKDPASLSGGSSQRPGFCQSLPQSQQARRRPVSMPKPENLAKVASVSFLFTDWLLTGVGVCT